MIEALHSIYTQISDEASGTSPDTLHAATDFITAFYVFVAREQWQEPEIMYVEATGDIVFTWCRHGIADTFDKSKEIQFFIKSSGVAYSRDYNDDTLFSGEQLYSDNGGHDYDVCARLWQWYMSPHRFAVGDEVKVVQYTKEYCSPYVDMQGTIAEHSVHDFVVPAYEVEIVGHVGPYGHPYIALSERSLQLAQQ